MERKTLFMLWLLVIWSVPALAADALKAAVAANFIAPFQEIAQKYETKTGVRVEAVYASSGKLYAQIVNGAPFDLFLSADEERPQKLSGQKLAGTPFVYAKGRVVLWTARKDLCACRSWEEVLARRDVAKLALANPDTAPYGAAAKIALLKAGLWGRIQPRLVFPEDIAQAFQYASTGAVDAGFCALSALNTDEGRRGCFLLVPQAPSIVQAGCLMTNSPRKAQAESFAGYLRSRDAADVIARYGYHRD